MIGELALADMYAVLRAEWRDMSGYCGLLVEEISRCRVEVAMAFQSDKSLQGGEAMVEYEVILN